MNFNIGDKVTFRTWEDMEKEFGLRPMTGSIDCDAAFTKCMEVDIDRSVVYTIVRVDSVNKKRVTLSPNVPYIISTDMLELAVSPVIVIRQTDNKTIVAEARKKNVVVKKAEAKCHPKDTFNFNIGASLAYDRLMNRETMKVEEHKLKLVFFGADREKEIFNGIVGTVTPIMDCTGAVLRVGDVVSVLDDSCKKVLNSEGVVSEDEDGFFIMGIKDASNFNDGHIRDFTIIRNRTCESLHDGDTLFDNHVKVVKF